MIQSIQLYSNRSIKKETTNHGWKTYYLNGKLKEVYNQSSNTLYSYQKDSNSINRVWYIAHNRFETNCTGTTSVTKVNF